MRLVKIFGLTALAAISATTFVGVTSAMAVTELEKVVFCDQNTSPCPVGHSFASNTVFHGELVTGTHSTKLTGLGNILCNESKFLGETTSALAHGKITAWSWSLNGGACENISNHEPCPHTAINLPYLLKGELNAAHNGYELLVTEEGVNGRPELRLQGCGASLDCSFGAANELLEQIAQANDAVWKILQTMEALGFFCGLAGNSVWHAEYLVRCLKPTGTSVPCWLTME